MTNFAAAIKDEISRLARKEIRNELEILKKSLTRQREVTSQLRETVAQLQRDLKVLRRVQERGLTHSPQPTALKATKGLKFSGEQLKKWRQDMGITIAEACAVIGTTQNSWHLWTAKDVHPQGKSLAKIDAAMALGKRELKRILKSQETE